VAGQTEVGDARAALHVHEDIFGLQIPALVFHTLVNF
jgi:hypothetical protein